MSFGYDSNWVDPKCADYNNVILRWIAGCPELSIAPVLTQPAAPRSVAEMSSGLWSPDDLARISNEELIKAREYQKALDLAAGGGNIVGNGLPPVAPESGLTVTEMLLLGALGFIGIGAIVKVIK